MTLRDLMHGLTAMPVATVPIKGVACHSKQVRSGDLFFALRGIQADGHTFIEEAIDRGASAIVAENLPAHTSRPCPCVIVRDAKEALAICSARFYGNPSQKLKLIGVTGTNGKTTTTYLLKAILDNAGERAGLIGTVVYQIGERAVPSTNTTPGSLELQRYFAQMVAEGLEWCAIEVSSHALSQGRIAGVKLDAAIFSNLGSDHLDYHKTIDGYAAAKRKIFEHLKSGGAAVVNIDDSFGRVLAETIPGRTVLTYGVEQRARIRVASVECSWHGLSIILETQKGTLSLKSPLLGRHNVHNITAAAATLLNIGIKPEAIKRGMESLEYVPGRLERVPCDSGFNILIDYAHTADALRLVLLALRELTRRRLLVVFGCGGNRDGSKRPIMGRMAGLLADHIILTSDNPRKESPLEIINQIKSGFPPGFSQYQIVPDREQAIAAALSLAQPEDSVLIAGKGHESYQVFDRVSVPFSDRDVVERILGVRSDIELSPVS